MHCLLTVEYCTVDLSMTQKLYSGLHKGSMGKYQGSLAQVIKQPMNSHTQGYMSNESAGTTQILGPHRQNGFGRVPAA